MKINNSSDPALLNQQDSSLRNQAVAREFEALFIQTMMQSMRKTVGDNELIPQSFGEKIYTDILDTEYAGMMANTANFGLANLILKQIEQTGGDSGSINGLRGLGSQPWLMDNRFIPSFNNNPASLDQLRKQVSAWKDHVDEASKTWDVDSSLISAVIAAESAGNQYAVSRAGAKGLMQLMDGTAAMLGTGNVFNARQNIMSGTQYLRTLLDRYDNNEKLALASYNAGPGAVDKYNGVPPYRETVDYVNKVARFKKLFEQTADGAVSDESTH